MTANRNLFRSVLLLGSAVALTSFATGAHARGFAVLHSFAGAPNDGSYPYNSVTFDAAGNLYSAVNLGGTANAGVIMELAPDGTETILHSFDGASGGSDPNGGVTLDSGTGDIYGTTTFGGKSNCRNGCGVLYRLAASGKYKVLHKFDAGRSGSWPVGRLVRDAQGNLFGVATFGGAKQGGTVYEYSAAGKYSVLHAFSGADGFSPQGSLIEDAKGNLYGITNSGGADQYGTIFELTPRGKLKTLYSFTGGADGGYPMGGLDRDGAGNLYGATNLAGNGSTPYGTVFKLAPDGSLTTLYTFAGGNDGGYPQSGVLLNKGKLYGTTSWGGTNLDGVVYDVDIASGTETVLHNFAGSDGSTPEAGLTRKGRELYGTASGGGTDNLGVVFELKK